MAHTDSVYAAFHSWRTQATTGKRERRLVTRALMKLIAQQLTMALEKWRVTAARGRRTHRQVLQPTLLCHTFPSAAVYPVLIQCGLPVYSVLIASLTLV